MEGGAENPRVMLTATENVRWRRDRRGYDQLF